jgi:hypothetical protein
MHPLRKESVVWLVLGCLLTLVFAWAMFHHPHWLWLVLLGCFLILSTLTAWRVFVTPDDWYRAKEFRKELWMQRHPHIAFGLIMTELLLIGWQLVRMVKNWLI